MHWTSTAGYYEALGIVGALFYIGAYAGLQLGFLRGTGLPYILMNLAAATFVLVSLVTEFNLASAIIQVTWIVLSLVGLARNAHLNAVIKFTPEESVLLKEKFPSLTKPTARNLLSAGLWMDAEPVSIIAREGEEIGALFFLASGSATVTLAGTEVGRCAALCFIGEMTCLDGGPASATVEITSPSRLFRISTEALNQLCRRDAELRMVMRTTLGEDTRLKLIAANEHRTTQAASG